MPDPVKDSTAKAGTFLTRKVGPLPLWAWMAIAGGVYWYFSRKQSAASTTAAANQQTDPAGNVGSIDPATGYVAGSPEDLAALAANNAGTTSTSGTGTGSGAGSSGAQTYADNNSWGIAAVSLLDGLGVDPVTASQAIQLYLASQPLTPAQQGDVNLAIKALGPPPSLPGPVTGNPPPVTVPGGGTGTGTGKGKTAPPPTGLTVTGKHATSAVVKWNRSSGATGYMVKTTDAASKKVVQTGGTKALTANIGNLVAGHTYDVGVWAQPGDTANGPHASVTFTLPTVAKLAGK